MFMGRHMMKAGETSYELVAHGIAAEIWSSGPAAWKGSLAYEGGNGSTIVTINGVTAREAATRLEREARHLQRNLLRFLGPIV